MVAVLVVFVAIIGLSRWTLSVYSITPGHAESVAPLITVKQLSTDQHSDKVLLTDVYLNHLNALTWIQAHFHPHAEFVTLDQLLPSGIPASQLNDQAYIDMENSKDNARVAALTYLGWTIPQKQAGATVYAVTEPSPAATAGLEVGDRVVAAGSTSIRTACDLVRATHDLNPGTAVSLRIAPAKISDEGLITYGALRTIRVVTAKPPVDQGQSKCAGITSAPKSIVGEFPIDAVDYRFPGTIDISTPNIGGPSAGLAMTLALIDRLSEGSLTGHRVIAATGTIDPLGRVGDVGGVSQKAVAVERAGGTIFVVPRGEVVEAHSTASKSLRIIGVSTLAQVLAALRHFGGATAIPITKPYSLEPLS